MKFFTASRFGNGCRNNNLMNSKIVTFYTILHVTIHILQKIMIFYTIKQKSNQISLLYIFKNQNQTELSR